MKDGQARALFERSVRDLDDAAVKRLRLARRAALAGAQESPPAWRGWPAGLATAAVLAVGVAWWWPQPPASVTQQAPVAAATEADAEEPVLAEAGDDADLYAWLGEAPVASDQSERHL